MEGWGGQAVSRSQGQGVCVPAPRLVITSGKMWHDMDPYDWLNKFYGCYMTTVVSIVNGHSLGIDTRHGN